MGKRPLKFLLVFVLVTMWVYSGWPQIWNFPPVIQKAQAAVSFIGSAVNSSSPNAGTSVDVSGIGIQADDLIIVGAAVGDTVSNGLAAPTEGGYSRVPGVAASLYANDTNDTNLDLYYKVAAGTETAVSFAAVGGNNASNAAVVMVFRGVDTTTPFDTNANTATGIDTSNADPPSHDWSGAAGVWTVIAASTGHTGGATAAFTFPTGYTTNAAQRAHDDTIDVLVGMGYKTSPADPENPAAFSAANIGTASANSWAAATISLKPAVTTLEQSGYRFFENSGTVAVSNALAVENASATTASLTSQFRLRMLLHVSGVSAGVSSQSLKLRYAKKGTGTCASPEFSYADVTASSLGVAYNDNGTPADGDTLTENATDDPTHSGHTKVIQTYEELNNFSNSVGAIPVGQDGLWDFSLKFNSASSSAAYCLKAVKSVDSSDIDSYSQYPEISTPADYTVNQLSYRWYSDDGGETAGSQSAGVIRPDGHVSNQMTITNGGCTEAWCVWDDNVTQPTAPGTGSDYAQESTNAESAEVTMTTVDLGGNTAPSIVAWAYVNGTEKISVFANDSVNGQTTCINAVSAAGPAWVSGTCTFATALTQTALDGLTLTVQHVQQGGAGTNTYYAVYAEVNKNVSAATPKQNENTAHTNQAKNETLRVRVLLKNDGPDATGSLNHRLQFARKGTGTCTSPEFAYAAVPATSGEVIRATSTYYANQDASTNASGLITDPSGSFVAGKLVEDPDNDATNMNLAASEFTEHEYAIRFTSDAPDSGYYCFRITKNNTAFSGTYNYAEIQMTGGAPTVSCSTNVTSTAFGTLATSSIGTSSPNASSTMTCDGAQGCTLYVQDAGNGSNPGLATTTPAYLVPSPASGFPSTAVLSAGTEGYGIIATTTATGSGGTLSINSRYLQDFNGNTVGGLTLGTTLLASSTSAVTNREIVVKHKAAISVLTYAASYLDTITYSCTGN